MRDRLDTFVSPLSELGLLPRALAFAASSSASSSSNLDSDALPPTKFHVYTQLIGRLKANIPLTKGKSFA